MASCYFGDKGFAIHMATIARLDGHNSSVRGKAIDKITEIWPHC